VKTEIFDKELFDRCVKEYKLTPTVELPSHTDLCDNCQAQVVAMRLDNLPNNGFQPSVCCKVFFFRGCPNCWHVSYDQVEFRDFAGKKCDLKDYLAKHINAASREG
jgi:hypothetical protein